MRKIIGALFTLLLLSAIPKSYAQNTGVYAIVRAPQFMNYNFNTNDASYTEGLSAGIGLYHKSLFIELAPVILEDNYYGYYTFFGSTIKRTELSKNFNLNTSMFGEVTTFPEQSGISDGTWIYTGGLCLFPNVQVQRMNLGVVLCTGLAYQDEEMIFNNRFVLNLTYTLTGK
ncbi:hypothetical protein [Reichenbachiella versicolor]|uniref:hypothetical protein n=1 Tax=Reichenbachiella versicolor TaxID=1821036 RepID=UPI000D6DEEDE|nr:hypothetical protein [Reichenbachiella versicolor]